MRKLNIKLLSTVSALAFVVVGAAARADTQTTFFDPSLDPQFYVIANNWNYQNVDAATHAAIDAASQIAAFYGVQVGSNGSPTNYVSGSDNSIDQGLFTALTDSTYDWVPSPDIEALLVINGNSLSADTRFNDATITDVYQFAATTFQTALINVQSDNNDSLDGSSTVEIQQYLDGAFTGDYLNFLEDPTARPGAYTFGLISRNEINASASEQGTAVIDGSDGTLDLTTTADLTDVIHGTQQAVVSLNSIAVSAADEESVVIDLGGDSLIGLNNSDNYLYGGQGFDVQGVSGGVAYWDNATYDNEDPYTNFEQFTLEATNWAGAYAPHPLTNDDPAVMNLDQKAFVTANTITVGNTVVVGNDSIIGDQTSDYGTADFTIMATVGENYDPENSGYSLGQFANFNGNDNNIADAGWGSGLGLDSAVTDGEANFMSEVNVRNTAIATTLLDDYLYWGGGADVVGGPDVGNDSEGAGISVGALESGLDALPYKYHEGIGDVALSGIGQVASVGVNAISNIGLGDMKLISGVTYDPESADYLDGSFVYEALDFTQSVENFVFSNGSVNAGSSFDNNDGDLSNGVFHSDPTLGELQPEGFINTALATTDRGNVSLDGVAQTTAFAFNSIHSVGNILGWTTLDPENPNIYDSENPATLLAGTDYGAGIVQTADTSFYISDANADEDALNGIDGWTNDGNVYGNDLSQVASITANTMASNSSIIADISQTAVGDWYIYEPNDLELDTNDGAITGGNLQQTALYTANSITTADLLVANKANPDPKTPGDYNTVSEGGDLIAALVTQDASELVIGNYSVEDSWIYDGANLNEIDLSGDTIDVGKMSQVFQIALNKIDVAGDILIGEPGDETSTSLLSQVGENTDLIVRNEIYNYGAGGAEGASGAVSLGAGTDAVGVQVAYLNVNSIAAGGTLSGNVDQDINANAYAAYNTISGYSTYGAVDVANFAQQARVDLNTISAGEYVDANIEQHINTDLVVDVQNFVESISDHAAANIEGVSQQAIINLNTIGG